MPPNLATDFLARPRSVALRVALDPVPSVLNSLLLLNMTEKYSGLGDWVGRSAARLSPALLHRNRLVLEGLFFALQPDRRWPSFPAYLDGMAQIEPTVLRDRLLHEIARPRTPSNPEGAELVPPAYLLAKLENYIGFLREYFCDFDEAIETEAHALLNDPPAMRNLIVSHLRELWDDSLAAEWERSQPLLHETVAAFQHIDLARKSPAEAIRLVTGHDPKEKWDSMLANARELIFVPSAHIGPYLHKWGDDASVWLVFGARLPDGAAAGASALSRSDLLVRLSALTDDTRLRILALLSQHDELCAQDIMTLLDLTQSATSRHLRQLSATGYITERRREIAKCYTLNRERIGDTFRSLERFLERM